jgi:hypothetical protein
MLGYRRRSFARAHSLLNELRADIANLTALSSLQRLLIDEITRAEQKVRDLKRELSLRKAGLHTTTSEGYFENRIERLRQLKFFWRSFGDAVAFLYMDKFALKQTHYNIHNMNPKQDAGFLMGKEGLRKEIALMEAAIAAGIPSLLVDVTNTIRHGDVCFMIGADPQLIEVKSGSRIGSRGRRQVKGLERLHDFFKTDHAKDFRGLSEVRRVEHGVPERVYVDEINLCIEAAIEDNYAVAQPERGLYYIAMKTNNKESVPKALGSIAATRPWAFSLNEFKVKRAWAPYSPFTLSIRSEKNLYDFLQGDLYLLVIVDIDVLCQIAADLGFTAKVDLGNEEWPFTFTKSGVDGHARISMHMLKRIALEFTSPEWVIRAGLKGFESQT